MALITGKSGKIRLYDSTATAFYLEFAFENGDLTCPMRVGRPDERVWLQRNDATVQTPQMLPGSDEGLFEGVSGSFSAAIDTTIIDEIRTFLAGEDTNSNALESTRTDHSVTATNGTTSITLPAFTDAKKFCCDIEIVYSDVSKGYKLPACWFPPNEQTFRDTKKGDDPAMIDLNFTMYADMVEITAFTAGTDVTA